MKYYSEKLNKIFDTSEEVEKAEKEHEDKVKKEEADKKWKTPLKSFLKQKKNIIILEMNLLRIIKVFT